MDYEPDSLLGRLHTLPDPRRRQGRRYPLAVVLGLLILATLHGESWLRGMWLWSRNHWHEVWWPLGFGSPHFPALTTRRVRKIRLRLSRPCSTIAPWFRFAFH